MSAPVARQGDGSSHGGVILTGSSTVTVNGQPVARVLDLHVCPIPGHGTTAIVTGSAGSTVNGRAIAIVGSLTGCGALITEGSPDTTA